MYTQCPFCQTVFGVAPQHLAAADGQVRCGYCQQLFNAEENLLIDLPEAEQQTLPEAPVAADDHAVVDNADEDEEPDEAAQSPLFRQTALSPPTQEDEQTLNAIFADLDTRLVRMKDKTTEPQQQEDDGPAAKQRIDPTITLNWEDMEADGFYPPPPMKNRGPQEPYIDPDDLDALDRLAFEGLQDTASQLAEPGKGQKPVGNWDEVDDYRATEFIRNTAAAADEEKKSTRARLLNEDELGRMSAGQRIASESAQQEEEQPQGAIEPGAIKPPMDFETREQELPFHLRDAITTREAPPRSLWRILGLILLLLLAIDGIVFQLALFRNVELANRFPQLKSYLSEFCRYFPCSYSGPREVGRIYITDREVRSHPQVENALLVSAVFVNRAGISQPYPNILLTLSDLTNTVVAQRRFTPADYLSQGQDRFELMEPDVPTHIQLEVLDPGNDAVNFEFTFL